VSISTAFSPAFDVHGDYAPLPGPTLPWPANHLTELASCLCAELGGGDDLCFCGVIAADQPVLDYCGACEGNACGEAWVRLVTVIPIVDPSTTSASNPCNAPLQAAVEVGVARCAPMPGDDGEPPSMADQLEAALQQVADMRAALRAIRCCPAYGAKDFDVVEWLPIGPEGGCLGGAWAIVLREV
jgi:hypothetical protein